MARSSRNSLFKFLLVVFVCCAHQGLSSALTFNVCADDYQWIYADGVLIGSQTKTWYVDLPVTVPTATTILGVKVKNNDGPAGVKGYFSDGRVMDGSWKCTSTAQADDSWTLATFDDSKWTAPVSKDSSPGCNGAAYSSAKWLWTEATYSQVTTIYCRKRLELTFNVCADDYQWIYADGVLIGSQTKTWYVDLPVIVPANTKVLSVKVKNNDGPAGVKGYFSNGQAMDGSWKCTSTAQADDKWTLATFDDSKWVAPVSKDSSPGCNAGVYSSIKWLWTEPTFSQVTTIYCRKRLALQLNVCADDYQWIYGDGVLLGSQTTTWYVDLPVTIPATTTVVGVKVKNNDGPAGLKGYFSDGRVIDGSWKCTSTAQADDSWSLATFDDSKWTAPVSKDSSPGCNGAAYSSAKWLWTEATYSQLTTVYCRKKTGLTFNVCSDDYQWIFADGVLLGSQTKTWYVDLQVKVPYNTRLLAVRVINNHGPAGVKGYLSDGRVMDGSWKCTSTAQADNSWTLATFDDSKWVAPVSSGTSPAGCNAGAYSSAKWLWTEATYSQVTTIYCRKRLD